MLKTTCPKCSASVRISDDRSKEFIECSKCGHEFARVSASGIQSGQTKPKPSAKPAASSPARKHDEPTRSGAKASRTVWLWVGLAAGAAFVFAVAISTIGITVWYLWNEVGDGHERAGDRHELAADLLIAEVQPKQVDKVDKQQPDNFPKPDIAKWKSNKKDWPDGNLNPDGPRLEIRNGEVNERGMLHRGLEGDPVTKKPRKIYRIRLSENQQFSVELRRLVGANFDPCLRIESDNGEIKAAAGPTGPNLEAQLKFTPKATAEFRVVVTSNADTPKGEFLLSVREAGKPFTQDILPFPSPVRTNTPLSLVMPAQVQKVKVTCCPLDEFRGDMIWHIEGKSFFVLTRDGVLRRLALPGFVEEFRLDTKRGCQNLTQTKLGLVVTFNDNNTGELWLIDPDTLTVRRAISQRGRVSPAFGSPGSNLIVTYGTDTRHLVVIDVEQAREIKDIPGTANAIRWSADGAFLYCLTNNCIVRYKVEGRTFTREQATLPIANGNNSLILSPDDQWICVAGDNKPNLFPNITDRRELTYIFKTSDLTKPACIIPNAPRSICFDLKQNSIITFNPHGTMIVHSTNGGFLEELNPRYVAGSGPPSQSLVLPTGELLSRCGGYVCLLEVVKSSVPLGEQKITKAPRPIGDLTLHELLTTSEAGFVTGEFSGDGAYLFISESKTRILRRIRVKDMIDEARIELSGVPTSLAMNPEGLVCGLANEIVVVDPVTLKEIRRFPSLPTSIIMAIPNSPLVMNFPDNYTLLNVKTGEIGPGLDVAKPDPKNFAAFARQVVTSDGKYLFVLTGEAGQGEKRIHQFKRKGMKWEADSVVSISTFEHAYPITSPDGKFLAVRTASDVTVFETATLERVHHFKVGFCDNMIFASSSQQLIANITRVRPRIQVYSLKGEELHHFDVQQFAGVLFHARAGDGPLLGRVDNAGVKLGYPGSV